MTERELIVKKLQFDQFLLDRNEINYIVKDWVSTHSQHKCTTDTVVNKELETFWVEVNIDKESIFI